MRSAAPRILLMIGLVAALLVAGCTREPEVPGEDAPESLEVTSEAFSNGGTIPAKYTCDGANVKPPLTIDGLPDETRAIALIVDDPDAPSGTFTHYTVWNIEPDNASWQEAADLRARGAVEGATSFEGGDGVGWRGPCPPPETGTHRYFFRAYALDEVLDLERGASRDALEERIDDHAVARGSLMGTYGRGG